MQQLHTYMKQVVKQLLRWDTYNEQRKYFSNYNYKILAESGFHWSKKNESM